MKNFMGKASAMKGPAKNEIGGGIPGAGSRGRINEAAGVKTKGEVNAPKAGSPIGTAKAVTSPQPAVVASADSPHVMPAKHPAAKTTAVKGAKVGW